MAIRKYTVNATERAMLGATEIYVIKLADWVKNATTTHTLCNLKAGDIILPQFCAHIIKTAVAGPTATLTLGISGTVGQFIAATTVASGTANLPTASANTQAEINRVSVPYLVTADDTLVAQAVLSNVTVTAGEVWIPMRILRRAWVTATIL